jgi:hypothetical protein
VRAVISIESDRQFHHKRKSTSKYEKSENVLVIRIPCCSYTVRSRDIEMKLDNLSNLPRHRVVLRSSGTTCNQNVCHSPRGLPHVLSCSFQNMFFSLTNRTVCCNLTNENFFPVEKFNRSRSQSPAAVGAYKAIDLALLLLSHIILNHASSFEILIRRHDAGTKHFFVDNT